LREAKRTIMSTHMGRTEDLRIRQESGWQDALDGEQASGNRRSAVETWQDEAPRVSLARRLERDQSFAGRVARRLFIEGWMGISLVVGLILLGLIRGFLGGG
jgi:hypothetical protein